METDFKLLKTYIAPAMKQIIIDNQISLALESENDSEPPILESRNFHAVTHSNPYQTI
jgi:hypothetical protein